jgi:hypothetical protein
LSENILVEMEIHKIDSWSSHSLHAMAVGMASSSVARRNRQNSAGMATEPFISGLV